MLVSEFKYRLIRNGKAAATKDTVIYQTQISPENTVRLMGMFGRYWVNCQLNPHGFLYVYGGCEWDMGTGAVNTPAMVRASLAHDMICHMTDNGYLPWSDRAKGDKLFYDVLGQFGAKVSRLWRYPAVVIYSQGVARWRRNK